MVMLEPIRSVPMCSQLRIPSSISSNRETIWSCLLYTSSGCGPVIDSPVAGKVGKEYTKEEAQVFSRNSMLNVLAVLQDRIGDLNKVKQAVKILVYVASDDDFYDCLLYTSRCV